MKRIIIAAAAALALALPAHAADKGAATFEDIIAQRDRVATCYVETSVAGTFLRDTREAQAGIGGGCDAKLANLVIGAGLRADFADWRNAGSIFAKLGLALNAGAIIYGLAEWRIPEWKPQDAGQLAIGGGGEVKLELLSPNLWLFTESTFAATKWGTATKDDVTGRIGVRFKF